MENLDLILDGLKVTGQYIVTHAGGIVTMVAAALALYGANRWQREYRFKRNTELLEEALVLFYQAEHAIAYLRNGFIFKDELVNFEFPLEFEDDYCKPRYKYTYVIQKRFDERQEVFNKLYAIEFRVRARFGDKSTAEFASMKKLVHKLLFEARQYSEKELANDRVAKLQHVIWKDWAAHSADGDRFGADVTKTVSDFDTRCRKIMH